MLSQRLAMHVLCTPLSRGHVPSIAPARQLQLRGSVRSSAVRRRSRKGIRAVGLKQLYGSAVLGRQAPLPRLKLYQPEAISHLHPRTRQ